MAQVNKKFSLPELKKNEQIVIRVGRDNNIEKVIFPNPVMIGLEENNLRSLLTVNGSIKINKYDPDDFTEKLYNKDRELWFDGMPLIRGGRNSELYFDTDTNILTLTGTFDMTGSLYCDHITGSLTQLSNGEAFIQAGERISIYTGSHGQIVITADVQDTGIRATTTVTAVETIPANLNGQTIIFSDASSHVVTFTYDSSYTISNPQRVNATTYKIGCSNVTNTTTHATALYNTLQLAQSQNDLLINSTKSDNIITLQQETGGTIGNVQITGTAVTAVDVIIGNSGYFVGGANIAGSVNAEYLVLNTSGDLNNERVFTPGFGLTDTVGSPGGLYTLDVDTTIIPALDLENTFTQKQTFTNGIYGTHQYLANGQSAFRAGANVQITNNIDGSITISSTDTNSTYTNGLGLSLVGNQFAVNPYTNGGLKFIGSKLAVNTDDLAGVALTSNLSNKLDVNIAPNMGIYLESNALAVNIDDLIDLGLTGTQYTAGAGLTQLGTQFSVALNVTGGLQFVDSEVALRVSDITGSGIINDGFNRLAIDTSLVAMRTGTSFSGPVIFNGGLSGSLTHISGGLSYLVAGNNIEIVTGSNGQITISSIATGTISSSLEPAGLDSYVQFNDSGSLGGSSYFTYDKYTQSLYIVNLNSTVLTGSLTHISGGLSYLVAGDNIRIVSNSNGQVTISADNNTVNNISTVTSRIKNVYTVTESFGNNTIYSLAGTNFATANYDNDLIDIIYNGVLLTSGTANQVASASVDYSLINSSSLIFAFDLLSDDIIQTIVTFNSASDSSGSFAGGYDSHVQFNEGGLLAGSSNFTYDKNTATVNIINLNSTSLTGSLTHVSGGMSYLIAGDNISITTNSNGQVTIATDINNISAGYSRIKNVYIVTESFGNNIAYSVNNTDFKAVNYDNDLIDITYNGTLLTSGSINEVMSGNVDYSLINSSSLVFAFDLLPDDIIHTIVTLASNATGSLVGGYDTQIQFNDGGLLAGSSDFTYDKNTATVYAANINSTSLTGSLTKLSSGGAFIVSTSDIITVSTSTLGSIEINENISDLPVLLYTSSNLLTNYNILTGTRGINIDNTSPGITNIYIERLKTIYTLTGTHNANSPLTLNTNFQSANFDEKRIDVFVNGSLLISGSNNDYILAGNESDILMKFDLLTDDTVVVIIQ